MSRMKSGGDYEEEGAIRQCEHKGEVLALLAKPGLVTGYLAEYNDSQSISMSTLSKVSAMRWIALAIVTTGMLFTGTNLRSEAPAEHKPEQQKQAPKAHSPEDAFANEIAKLQKDMGGSLFTSKPYEEATTIKNTTHKNETFQAAVSRLAARDANKTSLPYVPIPASNTPKEQNENRKKVITLREAAWKLQQAAFALEAIDLFTEADRLREHAASLRQKARTLRIAAKKQDSRLLEPSARR